MYNLKKSSLVGYYWQIVLPLLAVILAGFFMFSLRAMAVGSDISKAYSGDEKIVPGSLVSLDSNRTDYVILANSENGNQLIGVAVDGLGSLIAIDQNENKIQVSINGSANTLVSTINGDIRIGDYISQSPVSGVGAKAKPGDKTVGIAQASFSSNTQGASKENISDIYGKQYEVYLGKIPVLVSANYLPSNKDETSSLEQWAAKIVGHKVSLTRIFFCGVVAVIALISLVIMVYSSIHNSIMAVSRNPLAKPLIFEALAQVLVMIMLVSVISVTTMYLVIRI